MRVLWLDMLALAALALSTTAAAPSLARADETDAGGEVTVPAAEERPASATTPPPATTAEPWWGTAVAVTPKPWWRGTGEQPWQFVAAAYGWLPNAPAEINLGPVDTTLPEDLGTILDSLQMAFMLDFEARKGRFGGYVAPILAWVRDDDETIPGPIREHELVLSEGVYLIDFGLSYEVGQWALWNRPDWVVSSPAVAVEPFFGARSLVDDITITLKPGGGMPARPSDSTRPDISFITPVVGLRTIWDVTDRFNMRIEGDYGGWDVDGIKRTWNAVGLVGYRFKPKETLHINLFAGYRYLYIHLKKEAEIKLAIKGAFVGIAFEFARNGSGWASPGR